MANKTLFASLRDALVPQTNALNSENAPENRSQTSKPDSSLRGTSFPVRPLDLRRRTQNETIRSVADGSSFRNPAIGQYSQIGFEPQKTRNELHQWEISVRTRSPDLKFRWLGQCAA
jgi:hypothetical protein